MSTIVLRSVKGSPLTNAEVDANFSNLNTDKYQAGGALGTPASGVVTNLTGTASININGTVGATTATTGAFTTLSATGVTTVQAGTAAAPAITTSGDTNTGIFFPAADTIAFAEGGAESMRIDSSGNLGIGTSSPAAKLEVSTATLTEIRATITGSAGNVARFTLKSPVSHYAWYVSDTVNALVAYDYNAGAERMRLDSSGNLGLGVTPSAWGQGRAIEVFGQGYGIWNGTASIYSIANAYFNSGFKYANTGAQASHYYQFQGAHVWSTAPSGTAGNAISFTQAMTLDANGRWLLGTTTGVGNDFTSIRFNSSGTYSQGMNMVDANASATGSVFMVFRKSDDVSLGGIVRSGTDTALAINGTSYLALRTGDVERARIDSSGNLGLGVTPSAWVDDKALQLPQGSVSSGYEYGISVAAGAFRTASNVWKYTQSAAGVSRFNQVNGSHQWFTALAGTAGNAITFTQAMTLDLSGNLGVGTTSPGSFGKLSVVGTIAPVSPDATIQGLFSAANSGEIRIGGFKSGGGTYLAFTTGADVERARIDSSGNFLVGSTSNPSSTKLYVDGGAGSAGGSFSRSTTDPAGQIIFRNPNGAVGEIYTSGSATVYATSSDYRLKDITGPITTSGAYIDSLNPVEGTWKSDNSPFVGLIAHEVQEASRTNVATGIKDGEQMQGMDYSSAEIIANLIAEVKSLRARLAAANI
jgi:hypothetical protein